MDKSEWLAARRRGIGGSDVAAILCVSPWTSTYSLWLDKTADEPPVNIETPAMAFGTLMEPVVADLFAEATGLNIVEDTNLYAHPEHDFMLANLDRVVLDDDGNPVAVLEIKTSKFAWDEVPAYYVSQIQHYMAVTGLQHAYCAALFGGEDFQVFEVPRDDRYIDAMIELEAAFWEKVTDHLSPEIDGSEATHKAVRATYEAEKGKAVELGPEIVGWIEWRSNAKEMVAQYEAEVREAEARIMSALQDAEIGTINGKSAVTWKAQTRSSLDSKALKEAHPDIAEKFTKSNTFRVLKVK